MTDGHRTRRPVTATSLALAGLLLLHAALAASSLWRNAVTIDEVSHLPAGISYWQQGTFAVYHNNPPLIKLLAALPVLISHPVVDYDRTWAAARAGGWVPNQSSFGADFQHANAARYFLLFNRARLIVVGLSLVGLLIVFLWARDLWGDRGGLLAAALWALDPNILAHAGLVTTDMGAAVAVVGAVFAFRRWLRSPSRTSALLAGVVLGAAQLVKFSCLLLYPLFALLTLLSWRFGARPEAPPRARPAVTMLGGGLLIVAASVVTINIGYGFEGTLRPLGSYPFLSPALTVPRHGGTPAAHPTAFMRMLYEQRQNRFEGGWLGSLPVPLPWHYLLGFDEIRFESNPGIPGSGFPVYLRGRIQNSGWWYYYLYALAVKMPIGTWLLLLGSILAAACAPSARGGRMDEALLLLPGLGFLATMSLLTGIDLGVRYVLPVLPFIFIYAGRLGRLFEPPGRRRPLLAAAIALALGWVAVSSTRVWPGYIAYFNEAAGGPEGGYRHLIDSNLDWGQDLLEARRWLDRHPQPGPVHLAYFGAVDPHLAGIDFRLPPRDPRTIRDGSLLPEERRGLEPGLYMVSANFVCGLRHRADLGDGRIVTVEQDAFGYFRDLKPVDRAGWSIWIYRLDAGDAQRIMRPWPLAAPAPDS
jgi:4-amino-4-deoxy-L-arabinose transferase-like glycosyltransferase